MSSGRFSLYYWGPLSYYARLIKYNRVVLEQYDNFSKQSYRNRCYIDGPNGELMLNLSIDHGTKGLMKNTRLSERDFWQQKHWQAIQTSYGGSPFFDALAPELELFYRDSFQNLAALNYHSTKLVLKWLRYEGSISLSKNWNLEPQETDHREDFHPKSRADLKGIPYPQVFDHKTGFKTELSILDLIFNEGPAAWDYLQQL